MAYVQAVMALVPYFLKLIDLFIKTPAQKQADLLNGLTAALEKAKATKGDTSDLENIIGS